MSNNNNDCHNPRLEKQTAERLVSNIHDLSKKKDGGPS